MGSELPCRATMGDRSGAGKALLETNELVFRGEASRAKLLAHHGRFFAYDVSELVRDY